MTAPADTSGFTFAESTWRALGTYVQLTVAFGDRLPEATGRAEQLLAQVDRACSRFRDDSDLTRANSGAGAWVRVDPLLVAAVEAALGAAEETDGLVDPTLGRSLVALGYDADLGEVRARDGAPSASSDRSDDPTAVPLPAVPDAWRLVGTDPEGAVRVPFGTALDLGATGKAFAADLIATDLADRGIPCIVSLGGDVRVGVPAELADDDGAGPVAWTVSVSELPDEEPQQTVYLEAGGMATSSVVHRRWTNGGEAVHHLLDPRTGRPAASVWRTVSVTADTAVAANTATTASIVLGTGAADWLAERDLAARLVGHDGRVLRVAGWPADGDSAATVED